MFQKINDVLYYGTISNKDSFEQLGKNAFLIQCCEKECDEGKDVLYRFIQEI